jgi:hypothetical protein
MEEITIIIIRDAYKKLKLLLYITHIMNNYFSFNQDELRINSSRID